MSTQQGGKGNPATRRMGNPKRKATRERSWAAGQKRKAARQAADAAAKARNDALRAAGELPPWEAARLARRARRAEQAAQRKAAA